MITFILILYLCVSALMIGLILLQKSEGGSLGGTGGAGALGGVLNARGTANLLTRATAILAALFFTGSLLLAFLYKGAGKNKSVLDVEPIAIEKKVKETDKKGE